MKKITAVIRPGRLEAVEHRLQDLNVRGLMIWRIVGFGEAVNLFRSDWHESHVRIEIFTSEERVQLLVDAICEAARSGTAGDGVVAIEPVDRFVHIRALEKGAVAGPRLSDTVIPSSVSPRASSIAGWILVITIGAALAGVYFVESVHRIHFLVAAVGLVVVLSLLLYGRVRDR